MSRGPQWIFLFALLAAASPAGGQTLLTGHYIPLFAGGLKPGVLLPGPAVALQNGTLFYHARAFTDDDGNVIEDAAELSIIATRFAGLWVTGVKLLGADYAVALAVPIANVAPNPVYIEGQPIKSGGLGLGDIALNPFRLGWHWTAAHAQFDYTVFLPVGRFEQGVARDSGPTC